MQEGKEQQRAQRVQEKIHQVMTAALESEQLVIEHVGEPRERKPVRAFGSGERPCDTVRTEALMYVLVIDDVERVVVIYKVVGSDLAVHNEDSEEQKPVDRIDEEPWGR